MFSSVPVSKTTGIGALSPIVNIASGRLVATYRGTISLGLGAANAGIAFAAAKTESCNHRRRSLIAPSAIQDGVVQSLSALVAAFHPEQALAPVSAFDPLRTLAECLLSSQNPHNRELVGRKLA